MPRLPRPGYPRTREWLSKGPPWLPALLVWVAGLLWVGIETLGRELGARYSPYEVVWVRYAVQLLVLLAIAAPRRRTSLARTNRPFVQAARGLLMLGMPICFVLAAERLPGDQVWAAFWVAPLLILALEPRLLGVQTSSRAWLLAVAGYVGALAMSAALPIARWATLLPIGMAVCFGLYFVLTRSLRDEAISTGLLYTTLGVLVPLTVILPSIWRQPSLHDGLIMVAIGVVGILFLWLLDLSLTSADVSHLAPHLYAQPVWVVAVSGLAMGEPLSSIAALSALIVAAVLVLGFLIPRLTSASAARTG